MLNRCYERYEVLLAIVALGDVIGGEGEFWWDELSG